MENKYNKYICKKCGKPVVMGPDKVLRDSPEYLLMAEGGFIDLYRHIREVHGLPHMPPDYRGDWDDFISVEVIPQYFDL